MGFGSIFGGPPGPGGPGGWYQPRGPYGAYPGCGCSSGLMILAGIFLVMAGMMRGCHM